MDQSCYGSQSPESPSPGGGRHDDRNRVFRKNGKRKGATTVEIAVVLPVILLFVFSSIEFARVMMVRQAMTNAVREGCRDACLATTLNSTDCEDLIRYKLRKVVIDCDSHVNVAINPAFSNGVDSLTTISAEVSVRCQDISWFPLAMLSDAEIRCSAQMLRE